MHKSKKVLHFSTFCLCKSVWCVNKFVTCVNKFTSTFFFSLACSTRRRDRKYFCLVYVAVRKIRVFLGLASAGGFVMPPPCGARLVVTVRGRVLSQVVRRARRRPVPQGERVKVHVVRHLDGCPPGQGREVVLHLLLAHDALRDELAVCVSDSREDVGL